MSSTCKPYYLTVVSNRVFQWKVVFDLDFTKQVHEMEFSRKTKKLLCPSLSFNNIPLKNSIFQKHLELTLDVKLNFAEYMKNITQKVSKTMSLLLRVQPILPRLSPLTTYKAFIRSQLYYADFIYDQTYNSSFHDKLESLQYNACLAIKGAIRWTSSEKLYQEIFRISKIETLV